MKNVKLLFLFSVLLLCCVHAATGAETYVYAGEWGSFGSAAGQFNQPFGVTVDGDGYVYVADQYNYRVQKFTANGDFVTQWGSEGTGQGQFKRLIGIAVDSSKNVYVVDYNYVSFSNFNSRVQKFSSDGTYLTEWNDRTIGAWTRCSLVGIAADGDGYVYVSDKTYNRVQKYSSDGSLTAQWGSTGSGNGQLFMAAGIAVDRATNVYVADFGNQRVQKFTSTGTYLAQWGSEGSGDGQFLYPSCIAIDSAGTVLVTDRQNNRVQRFSAGGAFLTTWGSEGAGDGQFAYPNGIAASGETVYVADWANHRIQIFRKQITPTASFAAYPQSGTAPLAVQFLDYSYDGPTGWSWDFGDGATSTEQCPAHTYDRTGLYTVSLTVTDSVGQTDTKTEWHCVRVTAPPTPAPTPVANFTANTTAGPAPMTVAFADASSPAPYHRWWTFGDGGSSTDANPVHTYSKSGTYTVNLTAWTGIGSASVSKSAFVTVGADPRAPTVNFALSRTSGTAPLYVRFTDCSSGSPTSWHWDFGGLAWTTATSPSVVFRQAGTYPVTLTVRNAFGSSTLTRNLTVTAPAGRSRNTAGEPIQVVG